MSRQGLCNITEIDLAQGHFFIAIADFLHLNSTLWGIWLFKNKFLAKPKGF